jgi:hypothetical protein
MGEVRLFVKAADKVILEVNVCTKLHNMKGDLFLEIRLCTNKTKTNSMV